MKKGKKRKHKLVISYPAIREHAQCIYIHFLKEEEKILSDMLKRKVIQASESEYASAPVLVLKKDGTLRYCQDYRNLNKKTVKDAYDLPKINDCLDTLSGNIYFSVLDLAAGYWQIPVREEDRHKTAFQTQFRPNEYCRMPFGLSNAPAGFQRAMNLVLRGLTWTHVLAYLDDVIVPGKSFENGLDNLILTFERARKHHLKFKPKKCALFQAEVEVLGKYVSRHGVHVTPGKMEKIMKWQEPKTKKELETYLGFMNYHRSFVRGYAGITACLYQLTSPGVKFVWTDTRQHSRPVSDCTSTVECRLDCPMHLPCFKGP